MPGDPERIASYRVLGRLGVGGMGTVYAATGRDGRRIALKVVHAQQAADPQFRARFHREVQVLRRVGGPCLVPLLDADPTASVPWLATDYIPGPTLDQHLAAHGPLADGQLVLFAAGTASALAAIHAAGVVHRDLKPANVILSPQGPRVLDFGIAHVSDGTAVTRTGILTGTPGWISPEYYRDGIAGAPGDVFAWGALIAYAASGRLPFGIGAPDVVAYRVMSGKPDLTMVPEDLRGPLEACLAKDPALRPPARALAEITAELLGCQATQAQTVSPDQPTVVQGLIADQWHLPTLDDPTWSTAATQVRRRRFAWVAVAGIAAFALAASGTWLVANIGKPAAQTTETSPTTGTSSKGGPSSSPATVVPAVGTPSPSKAAPASTEPPQAPKRTQVRDIRPWTADGMPADGINVTGETIGTCWGSSEATMRVEAWRCSAENEILDPCFAPAPGPEYTVLLCMGTTPDRMVRLTVTEPLPGNNNHMPGGPVIDPIIIDLADGISCRMMTGATTVQAGERQNYGCTDGGSLYGVPDKTGSVWTIVYRRANTAAARNVPIVAVYQ
nr:serine/threonine-protein kinase [Streptomyces sp. SID13666]